MSALAYRQMWYGAATALLLARLLFHLRLWREMWWMYFVAFGMAMCLLGVCRTVR